MADDEPRVSFGNVHNSTFAVGNQSRAESHAHYATPPAPDPETEELLAAVRELRAALAGVRGTGETTALAVALDETEVEIAATGQASPTRRERLRDLLADSQSLVTFLTSAGALAALLGR
ncbi:hypothetical protein ACIQOU_22400 [Streptomyces sp. NPDC091279]|uniref:hypothetical protein n=1 Tax=unclassified Streptomyces TaxID=2593676 RepID=UPI0038306653